MEDIQVMGVRGLPLIHAGDNIATLICGKVKFRDGDILSVASTTVIQNTSRRSQPPSGQSGWGR